MNIYEFRVNYDALAFNYPLFIEANTKEDAIKYVRDDIGVSEDKFVFREENKIDSPSINYLRNIREYEEVFRRYIGRDLSSLS